MLATELQTYRLHTSERKMMRLQRKQKLLHAAQHTQSVPHDASVQQVRRILHLYVGLRHADGVEAIGVKTYTGRLSCQAGQNIPQGTTCIPADAVGPVSLSDGCQQRSASRSLANAASTAQQQSERCTDSG